jgi:2-keto-4-pentenoate hydratase/2-oxohepta-3-ene-1,7-dioic acid hydratase in catechol pathway
MRTHTSFSAHGEPILRPRESVQLDYEGEVVLVIGRGGRRIPRESAMSHVFGYSGANEGSVRDWLRHARFNVTPGKNFDRSGSIGPYVVTADEAGTAPLRVITRVNGEIRQDDTTDRMIFPMDFLIHYISTFCTLEPGDIILTGTPSGAGARFDPPRYLRPGDVVEVEISRVGLLRNEVRDDDGQT